MAIRSSVSFYPCRSIEETSRFYEEILGLRLYEDQGSCRIYDTGYGYWGFCQYDDREPQPAGLCLSLNCESVEDVDRFYEKLHPLFPEATVPKKHPKFEVYSFFLKDPNGYTLEFQKILTPGK